MVGFDLKNIGQEKANRKRFIKEASGIFVLAIAGYFFAVGMFCL